MAMHKDISSGMHAQLKLAGKADAYLTASKKASAAMREPAEALHSLRRSGGDPTGIQLSRSLMATTPQGFMQGSAEKVLAEKGIFLSSTMPASQVGSTLHRDGITQFHLPELIRYSGLVLATEAGYADTYIHIRRWEQLPEPGFYRVDRASGAWSRVPGTYSVR